MRFARSVGLAVRLSVATGRSAVLRLVIIAFSVALGVALLLIAVASVNAVRAQNARYAWLATGAESANGPLPPGGQPLWARVNADSFNGQAILRVGLAATGPRSPVPPGIPELPPPGQYYASPAMQHLLDSTPAAELAARFPAAAVGVISKAGLPSPDSLIIIVGYRPDQLASQPGAKQVDAFNTVTPSSCANCAPGVGDNARTIDLILSVVAVALLVPVLIFIASTTRLSAARREQRFAAIRLVGASARQIALIATVESAVAALAGTLGGFGLFFVLRPTIASVSFTGEPFYVSDLSLTLIDVLLVVFGIPIAASLAAGVALRRVIISPLGVTKQATPAHPRAWRTLVLVAGIGELSYALLAPHPHSNGGQIWLYIPGFVLMIAGLVIIGPWLTWIASRVIATRAQRAATLIAARRLADNPKAAFRAISGLVLALFVGTVTVATITGFVAHRGVSRSNAAAAATVVEGLRGDPATTPATEIPVQVRTELAHIPGVRGLAAMHVAPSSTALPPYSVDLRSGLVACADLTQVTAMGRCTPGATVAQVLPFLNGSSEHEIWPAATVSPAALSREPLTQIFVATDGSTAAIERARTVLERDYPESPLPHTFAELNADNAKQANQYQRLADAVIIISLTIAGCSLAVSCTAGLVDRKRPFSLLRLSGARLATLRWVVVLETAVPLLAATLVAVGAGFGAAQLFLRSQLGYNLQPPGVAYYLTVLAGLVASAAIISSIFPVLRQITSPETARAD